MANTDDDKNTEITTDLSEADAAEKPRTDAETGADMTDTPSDGAPEVEEAEIVEDRPEADEPAAAEPEETPQPAKAAEPAPKRRGGILMPLIGGVLAAGVGYGAAQYVKPEGWPFPGTTGEDTGAEIVALADRLTALEGRVSELPTAPVEAAAPDMSAFENQISALAEQVATLETALENAEITGGGEEAAAALTAYQEEIEQMRAELAAQRDENARLADSVAAVADEAEAEIGAAMDRAAQVEARAAMLRVDAALSSGAPFEAALGQFGDIEVPAALRAVAAQGVATLAVLQEDFPEAARGALDVALQQQAEGDVTNRLGAFLRSQLGVRSLTPREGDDADAVLSRAEAALRGGDLAAALAELDALPEAARAEMGGWISDASARLAAVAAAKTLEQTLNSN